MSHPQHVCVCRGDNFHCGWAWISRDQPPENIIGNAGLAAILPLIANPPQSAQATADAQANAQYNGPVSRRCATQAALFGGNIAQCMALEAEKQRAQQQKAEQQRQHFMVSVELARHAHADFDTVVGSARAVVPSAMAAAIVESQHGGEIAYYLATHQDEQWKLAALPDRDQKREIKKIDKLVEK